jgi:hypothetical protein
LVKQGIVGELSPCHFSFMGGLRQHKDIENDLAPAIAGELATAEVDLALLVPY